MTIGGFGGRDPAPTVEQLESMVADGELNYVLLSGDGDLATWVTEHGTAVDGCTNLYAASV